MNDTLQFAAVNISNCTATGAPIPVDWMILGGILIGLVCGLMLAAVIIPWGRSP